MDEYNFQYGRLQLKPRSRTKKTGRNAAGNLRISTLVSCAIRGAATGKPVGYAFRRQGFRATETRLCRPSLASPTLIPLDTEETARDFTRCGRRFTFQRPLADLFTASTVHIDLNRPCLEGDQDASKRHPAGQFQ